MGERGGMLQVHCEDPVLLDAGRRRGACSVVTWHRATTLPRDPATSRRSRPRRAMAFARAADAPVHVVHLSSRRGARRGPARARRPASGCTAETCPHYLVLTDERYDDPDPVACARFVHLAAAPLAGRPRRAVGGPGRRLARPRRHRPRPRPARDREGRGRARACRSTEISNGAPGIETLLDDPSTARASPRGRITARADGRPPGDDAGAAVRARRARAPSRSAATPTSSCSTRPPAGRSAPPTSTTRATTRRTRASRSPAPSATSSSAAGRSSATAPSSATRGAGRFVERGASRLIARRLRQAAVASRRAARTPAASGTRRSRRRGRAGRAGRRPRPAGPRPRRRGAPAPRRGSSRSAPASNGSPVVERDRLRDPPQPQLRAARSRPSPRPP